MVKQAPHAREEGPRLRLSELLQQRGRLFSTALLDLAPVTGHAPRQQRRSAEQFQREVW